MVAATMAILDISGISGSSNPGKGVGGEEDVHLLGNGNGNGSGGSASNNIYENDDDDDAGNRGGGDGGGGGDGDDALLDGEGTQMREASMLTSSQRDKRPAAVKAAAAAAIAADAGECSTEPRQSFVRSLFQDTHNGCLLCFWGDVEERRLPSRPSLRPSPLAPRPRAPW